jgi:hypothetical protein
MREVIEPERPFDLFSGMGTVVHGGLIAEPKSAI